VIQEGIVQDQVVGLLMLYDEGSYVSRAFRMVHFVNSPSDAQQATVLLLLFSGWATLLNRQATAASCGGLD